MTISNNATESVENETQISSDFAIFVDENTTLITELNKTAVVPTDQPAAADASPLVDIVSTFQSEVANVQFGEMKYILLFLSHLIQLMRNSKTKFSFL